LGAEFGSDTIVALAGRIAALQAVPVRFAWNSGRPNGEGHLGFEGDVLRLSGRVDGRGGGLAVDLRATRAQVLGWQRLGPTRIGLRLRLPAGGGQEGLRLLDFSDATAADRVVGWLPVDGSRASLVRRWYEDRLGPYRKRALGTYVVAAVLAVCYVLQALSARALSFDVPTLLGHGANQPLTMLAGEPWRMLTAVFLHADFGHLLGNLMVLLALGPYVERLYSRPGLIGLFLGAGLVGSATDIFTNFTTVGVGASGAIFGVVGALLAYPIRRPGQLPLASIRVILAVGGLYMVWSLTQGFGQDGINNSAHVSGLVAGFLLGLVLAPPFQQDDRPDLLPLAAVATLLGVLVVCALAVVAGRASDDFRLASLIDQLGSRAADIDRQCAAAGEAARADPAKGRMAYEAACVTDLDGVEAQLRALSPADPRLKAVVAERLATIVSRREGNRGTARLFADIAALQPADEARIEALRGCDAALDRLRDDPPAAISARLRESCIAALDRALGMLDGVRPESPAVRAYRDSSQALWRAERSAYARIDTAVLRGDPRAFESAVDELAAAREAHAERTAQPAPG
jgi:membrane associated rhomboid family serine protease